MTTGTHGPLDGLHWTDDLALDLVQGFLPAEAEAAALAHAERCADCGRLLRGVVRDHEKGRILRRRIAPIRIRRRRRTVWLGGAVAAAAAIVVVLIGPWHGSTARVEWLPSQVEELRSRGVLESPGTERLARGLAAYGDRDIRGAIAALDSVELTGSLEWVRRLYLGSALVHAKREREAVTVLEGLPEHGLPEPWGDEGRWTLFVALRETGDMERALEVARRLGEEPTAAGARAREWLLKHDGAPR